MVSDTIKNNKAYQYALWCVDDNNKKVGRYVKKQCQDFIDIVNDENSKYYILEENTTVENMCKELRKIIDENKWLEGLNYKVRIWETPTSSCEL